MDDKHIKPDEEHKADLPLSSNFNEVKVQHFILDISCDISKKQFDCALTLFCKISSNIDSIPAETVVTHNSGNSTLNKNIRESSVFVCLDSFALDISSCIFYPELQDPAPLINTEQELLLENRLQIPRALMNYYHHIYTRIQSGAQQMVPLEFVVAEHSLLIPLPHYVDARNPVVLKICYRTQAEGPSLLWTVDQCGRYSGV